MWVHLKYDMEGTLNISSKIELRPTVLYVYQLIGYKAY